MAGLVVGGQVPIILTSRADNMMAHVASCGVARLLAASPVALRVGAARG
jgi:hypothetical protein